MSNIIPPLLSNTPPPPPSPEEDDEDEFGDFTGVNYLSYGCDNLSLPTSPVHPPKKVSIPNGLDINRNDEKNKVAQTDLGTEKDFQDKRKLSESFTDVFTPIDKIDIHKDDIEHPVLNCSHTEDKSLENSNDCSKNYSSVSVTVDKSIKIQLDKEYQPEDESTCDTNNSSENSINQNNVPIQKIFSTSNEENDKNTEFALKGDLNECSNFPVSGKGTPTEFCANRDIGLANENLGVTQPRKDNDFVNDSHFEKVKNVDNIENEFDDVPPFPEVEHESSDEDVSEIYPQNQIGDDVFVEENVFSVQLKNNSLNYVEDEETISDLKTSQTEEFVCSTIEEKEVESKEKIASNIPLDNHEEESCINDEFGDFAFADETINRTAKEAPKSGEFGEFKFPESVEVEHCEQKVDTKFNDDDFGEFSFPETYADPDKNTFTSATEEELKTNDDFDDFGEFTYTTVDVKRSSPKQDDVEFGNFANFPEVEQEPVILTLNEKQAFEKAECILTEIFPVSSDNREEYRYVDVEKNDFIFNELRDITETQALTYQWSKSASQNMLLRALNIDARNILYGPSWNPSIPRFAANLGLKPLEPIKTEILTPSVLKSNPSVSTQPPTIEIPTAQFDWNGSGLTNPLDYSQTMLLDLEQLVASLDIPSCNASSNSNNSSSPTNDLDDWDVWLQSVSKDPIETSPPQTDISQKSSELSADQVFTLQPTPIPLKAEGPTRVASKTDLEQKIDSTTRQFDDITLFDSAAGAQTHTSWQSVVPLRETYISNDNINSNFTNKELPLDIESWLQPTIVTPELPRKELEIGEEELPNIQTPELTRKNVPVEELEDDFDDFQMVLPETNDTVKTTVILQPVKPEPILPQQVMKNFEFSDLCSFVEPSVSKLKETPNKNAIELDTTQESKQDKFDDEDEFTDFHFSTPAPKPIAPKPVTPILEPLKPILAYPTVTSTPATQINWPDPGITEEEIKKFEMVFTRPKESKIEEPKREEPRRIKKQPSVSSIDDDEWSDFVSVQKPSPVHKFHLNEKERTSSPDLPLSVLNLGNIQPTKQPIPVITPQGLVQTKLSSNSSLNMSPKTQLKNNALAMQNKPVYQQPQIHPSIISNQYASQAYNFNRDFFNQNTKQGLNFPPSQQQKSLDEDDWSDFVSNPIPQTTANGYQQNWQDASSHQQPGWTTTSPNIITNPGHFVQSGSDLKNKKVNSSKKSTIPSISLPELEFIAPKGRTSSSRKK